MVTIADFETFTEQVQDDEEELFDLIVKKQIKRLI